MSNEKVKMTGKFWLGKGTLGKSVRQGEEIPEGYIDAGRFEKFEKEGLIGEKVTVVKPGKELQEARNKIKDLEKELEKAKQSGGSKEDKARITELESEIEQMSIDSETDKARITELESEIEQMKEALNIPPAVNNGHT